MFRGLDILIVDDMLRLDENILFEFLGILNYPVEDGDVVGTVLKCFREYRIIDILVLAKEAGLT